MNDASFADFNEMESAAADDAVDIVVCWDRLGEGNSAYYHVLPDTDPNNLAAYTPGVNMWPQGELDMGDPATLTAFTGWAVSTFSDDLNCLVIWNHGSGWGPRAERGVSWDETNGSDFLTTNEVRDAVAIVAGQIGRNLDILGFDACLMQMAEVAYAVRNSCDHVVGSEETEPEAGWSYDTIIPDIRAGTTPDELCSAIVQRFQGQTQSAFHCGSAISQIAQGVDGLASAMIASMATEASNIRAARSAADLVTFDYDGDAHENPQENADSYVDLKNLCQHLVSTSASNEVVAAANNLIFAIDAARIDRKNEDGYYAPAGGLSIYFPDHRPDLVGPNDFYANYQNQGTPANLDFTADTHWNEFLASWLNSPPMARLGVPYCYQDGAAWCDLATALMLTKYRSDDLHKTEHIPEPIPVNMDLWHLARDLQRGPEDPGDLHAAGDWITDSLGWSVDVQNWYFYDHLKSYLRDKLLIDRNPVALGYGSLLGEGHTVAVIGANEDSLFVSDPSGNFFSAMEAFGYPSRDSNHHIAIGIAWDDLRGFLVGWDPTPAQTLCITGQTYVSHKSVVVTVPPARVKPGHLRFASHGDTLGLEWDGRTRYGYHYIRSATTQNHPNHVDLGHSAVPDDNVLLTARLSNSDRVSHLVKLRLTIRSSLGPTMFDDSAAAVIPAHRSLQEWELFGPGGFFGSHTLAGYPSGMYVLTVRAQPDGQGALADSQTLFFYVYAGTPPTLEWAGTPGYESDGIDPNTGNANLFFEYRVRYQSDDNFPPASGYPRVTIDADGNSAVNSFGEGTFAMSPLEPDDNYTDGRIYTFRTSLPFLSNHHYHYRFEAQDVVSMTASGSPTEWQDGPEPNYTDLAIYADDIIFNPAHADTAQVFQIEARVHNESNDALSNVGVTFYDEEADTLIGQRTIAWIPRGTWAPVYITYAFGDPGFYPIRVRVDESESITEWTELNNNAVRGILVGDYTLPAWIELTGQTNGPLCRGFDMVVSGHASYRGVPQQDLAVRGAEVLVTLRELSWQSLGRTDDNGDFSVRFNTAGIPTGGPYWADVAVTDFTVTGQAAYAYTVNECLPPPATCHETFPPGLWWMCDWIPPIDTLSTYSPPDLTLELEFDSGCIHRGETPRPLSGRVRNVGSRPSLPCSVQILVDDGVHYTAAVEALGVGGVQELLGIPPIAFPGCLDIGGHTIYGAIDAGGQPEGNAPNSVSIGFSVWPDLPDAQAISLVPSVESPLAGQAITLSGQIRNQGGVPFGGTLKVGVVDSLDGSATEISRGELIPTPGPCGGVGYYVLHQTFTQPGNHILRMTADPDNEYTEWDEGNNTVNRSLVVRSPRPDFVVTYQALQAVPPTGVPGDQIQFRVEVRNVGETGFPGPVQVRFRMDGVSIDPPVVIPGGIPLNEARACTSGTYDTALWASDPYDHVVDVRVDPANEIEEVNEYNNATECRVPVDFTPVDISDSEMFQDTADPTPSQAMLGDSVEIHGRIKNLGCFAATEPVEVRFYDSHDLQTNLIDVVSIPSLGHHGAEQDVHITHVFSEAGPHVVSVRMDEGGFWNGTARWAEYTTGNNDLSRPVFVVTDLPDLTLGSADINPTLLTPCQDDSVTIVATIHNQGMARADPFYVAVYLDTTPFGSLIEVPGLGFEPLGQPPNYVPVQADAVWVVTTEQTGAHVIRVVADPEGLIAEQSEDNNEATRIVFVCENAPDLSVLAKDMSALRLGSDPGQPPVGKQFLLRSIVRNESERSATATVSFYYRINQEVHFIGNAGVYVPAQGQAVADVTWIAPVDECVLRVVVSGTNPSETDYRNNQAEAYFDFMMIDPSTGVPPIRPSLALLRGNVPNPFNPTTTVCFELPDVRRVSLTIYDVQGRRVRTLLDARLVAGQYALRWDGRDEAGATAGSGVYFCRMVAGDYQRTMKMVMLK